MLKSNMPYSSAGINFFKRNNNCKARSRRPDTMIRNYFTIAVRALLRNTFYAVINIVGLGIGIACCLLISLYVKDEWSFDRFHEKSSNIYRAYLKEDYGENEQFFNTVTPFPLGPVLQENFPDIEHAVRISNFGTQVKVQNEQFRESITVADPAFFQMFDFPAIYGNAADALSGIANIVLTREMALKYFGREDVIGKTLSIQVNESFEPFEVTCVVEDIPGNSSIRFGILASSHLLPSMYDERMLTSSWFNVTPETYVLIREGADVTTLESKFPSLFQTILGDKYEKSKYFVGLQPLTDIHLNPAFPQGNAPVSDPRYSYIMVGVALMILILASINFVTLSIGQTLKRSLEVGVRKVMGAARRQLIVQFIGESVLTTTVALVFGTALAGLSIPLFNHLSGKMLTLTADEFTIVSALSLLIIVGIVAGSYPAFVLSNFKPIAVLKGRIHGDHRQSLRKILVSVQLVLAVFFVSSTLIMRDQLTFLQHTNLGFNKEQTVSIQMTVPQSGRLAARVKAGFEKAELLKQEFKTLPSVNALSAAAHDFGNGDWMEIGFTDDNSTYRNFNINIIDPDFIPTMGIDFVAGRNFSRDNTNDQRNGIIVNEAFVQQFGWSDAIGKRIPGKAFTDHEIIGVTKDFHFESLYNTVKPLVMTMNPEIIFSGSENVMMDNSPVPKLFVKIADGETSRTIRQLEAGWKKISGEDSFTFNFVDERINAQYRKDNNLGRIITIATVLSILIGGLGLYGLSSLTIQNRVKEISIRKVFGATSRSLLVLLSKDFLVMLLINVVVSIPFSLYFMLQWLENYAYRVPINPWIFAKAGLIALIIGIAAISYHTIATVLSRPAKTLRNE